MVIDRKIYNYDFLQEFSHILQNLIYNLKIIDAVWKILLPNKVIFRSSKDTGK